MCVGVLYKGGLTQVGVSFTYFVCWCAVQGWSDRGWCVLYVLCIGVLYKGGLTKPGVSFTYCVCWCAAQGWTARGWCVLYVLCAYLILVRRIFLKRRRILTWPRTYSCRQKGRLVTTELEKLRPVSYLSTPGQPQTDCLRSGIK